MRGFSARQPPNDAIADRDDARRRNGGAGSVTARGSGGATLVAMVQAKVLPAQDGQLVSQGDEFELQGEATTNPGRKQGTEGGQKREHADDDMTVVPETLPLQGFWSFE